MLSAFSTNFFVDSPPLPHQLDGGLKGLLATPWGQSLPRIAVGDFNSEVLAGSVVGNWVEDKGLRDVGIQGATWASPGQVGTRICGH